MRATLQRAVAKGVLAGAAGLALAAQGAPPPATIKAGEAVYSRCLACHSLQYDRTGPRHCGLFGRRAGSVPGFAYSAAMKASGIVWTDKTIDRFVENPMKMLPGTSMGYAGVPDSTERAALIAYLRQASDSPECGKTR